MKKATVCITPKEGFFGPLDDLLTDRDGTARELIHNIRHQDDGSVVALYEYSGPYEALRGAIEEYQETTVIGSDPEVIGWEISRTSDRLYVYQEHPANAAITMQARLLDRHRLLVDPPIRFTEDGDLCIDLIGSEDEFGAAYEASTEEMEVSLARIGSAGTSTDDLLAELTDGEREVLATAVRLGYFENPREANYEEIAAELGCTKGTVGHHVRNAESKLVRLLFSEELDRDIDEAFDEPV